MSGLCYHHADEPLEDQGRRKGISPRADHATDVYPGKGCLFTTQVLLQCLVADGYGVVGLTRWGLFRRSVSLFVQFLSLLYDKAPRRE